MKAPTKLRSGEVGVVVVKKLVRPDRSSWLAFNSARPPEALFSRCQTWTFSINGVAHSRVKFS